MIVNELIVEEVKVTGEQGVKAYDIWGEKGLKKQETNTLLTRRV